MYAQSFHRMPRSLSRLHFYKAAELFSWIIYYSIPAIAQYLPDAYFQHWLLFMTALYTLLKESITLAELEQAEISLRFFVKQIDGLYGDREYTYNVHQLLHLALCVRRWGPLSGTSAFPFENYNMFVASCVHGTKHLGQEIVKNLSIAQGVKVLRDQCRRNRNRDEENTYKVLGTSKSVNVMNEIETELLVSEGLDKNRLKIYARAQINKDIYTSLIYKTTKTNSYTVQVLDSQNHTVYGAIRLFSNSMTTYISFFSVFESSPQI